jgi:hypothetical protein
MTRAIIKEHLCYIGRTGWNDNGVSISATRTASREGAFATHAVFCSTVDEFADGADPKADER